MPHEALDEQLRDDDYEDDDEEEEEAATHGDALQRYARQLRAQLLRWDPSSTSTSSASAPQNQRAFAAALTEIAALPLDALGMEARRLLVDGDGDSDALDASPAARVVAALSCRDVRLKCKAASALGSLCVSRVAGQRLLELHGAAALRALARMATCRNRWAQADAVSVLGWVVVIADEPALAQVARLLPAVVKLLHASAQTEQQAESDQAQEETHDDAGRRRRSPATEDASNLRVYALVLLLNFLQRDARVFAGDALRPLLAAVHALVRKLNAAAADASSSSSPAATPSSSSSSSPPSSPASERMDAAEFVEVARLTVTFLGLLLDQHEAAGALVLETKVLPSLLRLTKTLRAARDAGLLGDGGVDGLAASDDAGGLEARLAAIVDAVIARR